MKRMVLVLAVACLICGCSRNNDHMERAISLRQRILAAESCRFDAQITADYGDKQYAFDVRCTVNALGEVSFDTTAPETIQGIRGTISETGGKLTFEDTALSFPLLAEGLPSPVSAPWLLMKTLRSGYLTAVGMEEQLLRLTIHDSYQSDALQLDIWIDNQDSPVCADVLQEGRRILAIKVSNFQIL